MRTASREGPHRSVDGVRRDGYPRRFRVSAMKIAIDDIKASPKALSYTEEVEELNERLGRGVRDYRLRDGLDVDVEYYRSGLDIFFRGSVHGQVVGVCARCLEEYAFGLDHPFLFVLAPRAAETADAAGLTQDDMALSHYEGAEIDLTPLVHEQAILALPTRPLCGEGCRGLCLRCGTNLNAGPCGCAALPPDPRLAVLRTLAPRK
jgi:uncharacterized protein